MSKKIAVEINKKGRPIDWVTKLKTIKQNDDGITLGEITEHVGVDKSNVSRFLGKYITPVEFKLVGRQRCAVYSTEELRKLGREWEEKQKEKEKE